MARPKAVPKATLEDQIFKLGQIQCTWDEISAVLQMHKDTLKRRFASVYQKGKESGTMSLRRAMWVKATQGGSVPMMIFLSKQYLGFADKVESTGDGGEKTNVVIFETSLGSSTAREGSEAQSLQPPPRTSTDPQEPDSV